MVPVSRKSERIKINIRVSMSDEIARCLRLGRQVVPDLDKEENRLATLSVKTGNKFQRHL
jgi:hypothetical protein